MDEQPERFPGFSVSWRAAMLILVSTLLVWVLFWQAQMQMDPGSTAIVALAFTILVAVGQFLLSRLRRLRDAQREKPP